MGKVFLIIFDGLGDLPNHILKNQTPLEAANKPNIDYFTKSGKQGLMTIFKKDHVKFLAENGSNFGYISLFGADPRKVGWNRAPIEAVGINLDYEEGDLAIRFNYANINDKGFITDRRAGRVSNEEAKRYSEEISQKLNYTTPFIFKSALRHRGLIIFKSPKKLGEDIVGSDPLNKGFRKTHIQPIKRTEENIRSASLLRVFEDKVCKILKESKLNIERRGKGGGYAINTILTRGAGVKVPKMPSHSEWGAIATSPVEKGIVKLCDMTVLGLEEPEEDYKKDIDKTLQILKNKFNDFEKFSIILKQTDTYGHDGRSLLKKKVIEYADQTLFKFLKKKVDLDKDLVIITCDHATPTSLMRHTADPIPLLISGKGEKGKHETFNEKNCIEKPDFPKFMAYDLMKKIYKLHRKTITKEE